MTDDERRRLPRRPVVARVSLAMMTHAREANLLGNVHGGEIMKLADSTAGAVAHRHSGGPAVTAAMDEMAFLAPGARRRHRPHPRPGQLGRPVLDGDRGPGRGPAVEDAADEPLHVASAYFVFVAIDEDGRPREVPALAPETPDEVRRMREAEIRRAHRLARKPEIDSGRATD